MRRLLFGAALAALLSACAAGISPSPSPSPPPAPTPPGRQVLAGVVSGETVVEGEVELRGDLLVPAGARLVLRPGTTVYVLPSESTKIDPEHLSPLTELLVRGSLRIEGTGVRPVRFLPLGTPAEEIWWAGIVLDGAADSAIEGAQLTGAETGIYCIGASPRLAGNQLQGCRYGIIAQQESAPAILDNRIEGGEGGVFCWRNSRPQMEGNRIADNEEEGLFVDAGSRPLLGRNQITGNGLGLALYPRDLDLDALQVFGNRENRRWLGAEPRR